MTNRKYREIVIEFKKVSKRIAYLKIKNQVANITRINVYALTNNATHTEKEIFYEKLEETLERIPKHDTMRIMTLMLK